MTKNKRIVRLRSMKFQYFFMFAIIALNGVFSKRFLLIKVLFFFILAGYKSALKSGEIQVLASCIWWVGPLRLACRKTKIVLRRLPVWAKQARTQLMITTKPRDEIRVSHWSQARLTYIGPLLGRGGRKGHIMDYAKSEWRLRRSLMV